MTPRNFIFRSGAGLLLLSVVCVSDLFAQSGPISDKYIVLLNPGASSIAVAARHGLAPDFVYHVALHGYAGTVPQGRLRALRDDPRVVALVRDQAVSALARPGGG